MSWAVDGFPIDIAATAKWTRKTDVSQYPVEKGTNLTDHARVNEPTLQMEGVISDTPMGAVANHPTRRGSSVGAAAFQRLDAIQVAGQPVTVECSLGIFSNMILENVDITRDVKTRKGLKVTISFQRIRIEDTTRTALALAIGGHKSPDFGLSLGDPVTKEVEGIKKILWRKGRPPGSHNIVGQEVIESRENEPGRAGLYHLDGRPLSTFAHNAIPELDAFFEDWNRDARDRKSKRDAEDARRSNAHDKAIKTIVDRAAKSPARATIVEKMMGKG